MNGKKENITGKRMLSAATLALVTSASGMSCTQLQATPAKEPVENYTMATQGKFYCNINSLGAHERIHHKELTDRLIAARAKIVETDKGYEFQFSPSQVSLAELVDWVTAEGKCCPFFDFHLDLERQGTLVCLRLTGEEGIKQFIRMEFQVPEK